MSFIVIIIKPPHLYVNAILTALAIDYALVGFLYVFIIFVVEPYLIRFIKLILSSRSSNNNDINSSTSQVESSAKSIANHTINALLFLAGVLFLWANIWTSPNEGACLPAASIESGWDQVDEHCKLNRHLPYYLFFRSCESDNYSVVANFL